MRARIHVITLAVADLERALEFYGSGLGLESPGIVGTEFAGDGANPAGAVVMFQLQCGLILALYPRTELAKDANIPPGPPQAGEFSIGHEVSKLIGIRHVSGRVGEANGNGRGYQFRDLPAVDLLLQAAGPVRQVAPELCGPARRWRSLTPCLPVRHWHRNRQTLAEFLATDVNAELSYRNPSANPVRQASPDTRRPETWARGFRRYRMKEHLGLARPGLGLVLEFPDTVPGPLLLGQLSHFGYGLFVPDA